MHGLTSLWINRGLIVTPEINHRRAVFVLGRIDEILSWEKTKEQEKDVRFVELGEYLCEVRAKQYWRLENLKSFDEFLEKRFVDSRRKAYYLMAIHEHLTRVPKLSFERSVGQSDGIVKVARRDGEQFDCATWLHKAQNCRGKDSRVKSNDISLEKKLSRGKSFISKFIKASYPWLREPSRRQP